MSAFKQALHWLLDHISDIKKDNSKEIKKLDLKVKAGELKVQFDDLQRQIKEL